MTDNNTNTNAQTVKHPIIVDKNTECQALWIFVRTISDYTQTLTGVNREINELLGELLRKSDGKDNGAEPDWEALFKSALGAYDALFNNVREFGKGYVHALDSLKGILWGPEGEDKEQESE